MDAHQRFVWLASLNVNSLHLERNPDHACNYQTAAQWIEEELADPESPVHNATPEERQRMADTNTIWTLHIFPCTPIGSYRWMAPTAEEVIVKAMNDWPEALKAYPSPPKGG